MGRIEPATAAIALIAMAVLPLAEAALRGLLGTGIPGATPFVRHLTLWVGFLGAALAAREGKLLALATASFIPEGASRRISSVLSSAVGAAVATALALASVELARIDYEAGGTIAIGVPVWVGQLVLPLSFGLIALRLVARASDRVAGRAVASLGVAVGLVLSRWPGLLEGAPVWPGLLVLVVATALGTPIFAALGGAAVLLFLSEGVPAAAVPAETYRLAVSPSLAAIPLFTFTGFLLAEGRASERLLGVFRALFGSMPGGTAVVCAVVCAFFTAFTGGSGVTILALGGLLLPALLKEGYREPFSLGLLTASGSLGLLFPPALPLILYGIVAQVPIEDLFLGGVVPGILLVGLVAGWGIRQGIVGGARRTPFDVGEAWRALWVAKWELALPAIVMAAIFSGVATIVEASAITVVYALFVQTAVHRDLSLTRDLVRVAERCTVLVGGVLVILGVAMGFTSWLVDAQVPLRLLEWTQDHVHSPLVFLLVLNVFLLVVGCLMDIFSATIVVVPLIVPIGAAFGIDPVHLGIVFLANLELGYLTPPIGLNLFLASYRFERPLLEIYRAAFPFLVLGGIGVLLITYAPFLSTGLPSLLGGR